MRSLPVNVPVAVLLSVQVVAIGSCRQGFEFDHRSAAPGDASLDAGLDAGPAADANPDADPALCPTIPVMCPGDQPVRPIACGAQAGCWVGCRDGPVLSANDAAMWCQSFGGRLANIDSDVEEECLRNVLNGAIINGLRQAPGQTDTNVGWSWNGDGALPPYIRWDVGQPNDANGIENDEEQCVFSNSDAMWHDIPCDVPRTARFSCRYP